jgi:hypothetical protein
MSLAIEQREKLEELVKRRAVEVPQEETKAVAEPTEESIKPVAEEIPKEQPKEEVPHPSEKKTEEAEPTSWDADEAPITKTETPKFDLGKIGGALDLGEINSEDEFVTKVSELKSKLKEYEGNRFAGISDDVKEVIEVLNAGGDWKAVLSDRVIDYSKADPTQLFEEAFYKDALTNPKYFTDGKFNEQLAEEDLQAIPGSLQAFQGKQIAQGKIFEQNQRKAALKAQADEVRIRAEKSLAQATKELNSLLPKEDFGVEFQGKHSSEIYQGIVDSKLTKKYFGVDYDTLVRSGADMKEVAATIALRHYGPKMLKHAVKEAEVKAKKAILATTQNAQPTNTTSKLSPETAEDKPLSPAEKLRAFYAQNKKGL